MRGAEGGDGHVLSSRLADTPLAPFIKGRALALIGNEPGEGAARAEDLLVSDHRLQDVSDYRGAIARWFDRVATGGFLVLIVPHAFLFERQITLPSPWRQGQRRLYTPGSLAQEVEEALVPNSYRVRWLGDLDQGYDYALSPASRPQGHSAVAIVIERITPPDWSVHRDRAVLSQIRADEPDFAFEPIRTRVEVGRTPAPVGRILLMKLDHLGDLVMGLPALERMRASFPDARIDLVVGSWNAQMARELLIADRVIEFDAFPRNSTEQDPNVEATLAIFRATVDGEYDLAVDMRTDTDTRTLLRAVRAGKKAGIGTRSQFPYLDIALPLNTTRNEADRAEQIDIGPGQFAIQGSGRRSVFALYSDSGSVTRDSAIVWGPYLELEPGNYIFDFFIDLREPGNGGLLRLDVALDSGRRVSEMVVSRPTTFQLPFRVDRPATLFEARIQAVEGHPAIDFAFFGGRLIRQGRGNVLHQTEYGLLLAELVRLRMRDLDGLEEVGGA